MKIDEVMLEASVDRKQFGKETVRANQKANIARSAAFRKQMDAPSATEPAAPAPASGPVNYGKGTPGIPNIQVTPTQQTPQPAAKPATQTSPTPNFGAKGGAGTPVTLANPIAKPGAATLTPGRTPVPGAGMPTPPGAGMPKAVAATDTAAKGDQPKRNWDGKGAGGNLPGASFLKGFTKAAGMTDATQAIDAAQQSNIDYDLMAKQKAKAGATTGDEPEGTKPGEPATAATPAGAATPATGKAGELSPGTSKPGISSYGPKAAQPVTLANPIGQPGATTPDKETTLANPISAKPGEEKPGAAKPGAAAPAPAAAKGKTMTKQEILSWISRNDEDNAALQSFKDGISAAEKAGTPAGTDYGKATPGIQNVQAAPGKVSYAPKTAAAAPKGPATVSATMSPQPQMASKQYKKAPL